MLEDIDRTNWIEESKHPHNLIGKNIGLKYLYKDEYLEQYKTNKLFINSKESESIEHLTCKIYSLIESFFLSRRQLPEKIVLSKGDYQKLLDNTTIIDNNCILNIEVDLLKEKRKYDTNRNSNLNFRSYRHFDSNRHSFAK